MSVWPSVSATVINSANSHILIWHAVSTVALKLTVSEDSGLLDYNAVITGWVVPCFSKAIWTLQTSGTMHPMKQHHILQDLNPLYHHDNLISHKGKAVLMYAMKAHRKEQRALTLNLWTTRAPACLVSGTEPLEPDELEAGGAPRPVWMLWRREKFPEPATNQTSDHPACSLVTTPTRLSHV